MNEQLQNTVNEILKNAIDAATAGAEFLKDQAPDVVQQLIKWHMAEAGLYAGVELSVLVGVCVASKKIWNITDKWRWPAGKLTDEAEMSRGASCAAAAIISILTLTASLGNIFELIKLWIAPKVWLLEYAASLVKHG